MDIPALPGYVFEPNLRGVLSTVLTLLLPILAALLMKQSWSTFAKGLVLLGLAAVKVFIESVIQQLDLGSGVNWTGILYSTLLNFVLAVAMYFGLWKNTSLQQGAMTTLVKDDYGVHHRPDGT